MVWTERLGLSCHGIDIAFRANRPDLLSPIDSTFIPGSQLSASSRFDVVYSLNADVTRGIYSAFRGRHPLIETRDFGFLIDGLRRDVHHTIASRAVDHLFIHAGAVAWRGRAILFPGQSGSGKSTLVRELIQRGAGYLSDEFAVVDPDGLVYPFARPLQLRTAAGKVACSAGELGAETATRPLPVGTVIFTRYVPGRCFQPSRLTDGHATLQLLQHFVAVRAHPGRALHIATSVVSRCPAICSPRGDAHADARALLFDTHHHLLSCRTQGRYDHVSNCQNQ